MIRTTHEFPARGMDFKGVIALVPSHFAHKELGLIAGDIAQCLRINQSVASRSAQQGRGIAR